MTHSVAATPTFSILTPARNGERFLPECMASILGQTGADFEHIVVDGASTDNTVPYLRSIPDPRLRWISEPDQGPTDALNKAINLAHGDIVGFCNADDRYAPGALRKVAAYFVQHPGIVALYGDFRFLRSDGTALVDRRVGPVSFPDLLHAGKCAIPYPSAFIRRQVLLDLGGFDPSVDLASDYHLFLQIARTWGWAYLPEVVGEFRIHLGSITIHSGQQQSQHARAGVERFRQDQRWYLKLWVPLKLKSRALRHHLRSPSEARRFLQFRTLFRETTLKAQAERSRIKA